MTGSGSWLRLALCAAPSLLAALPMPAAHAARSSFAFSSGSSRAILEADHYKFEPKPYTLYFAQKDKLSVAVYEKGPKVVLQGKGTEDFVRFRLEPEVLGEAKLGYEEVHNPEMFERHFGIDESGNIKQVHIEQRPTVPWGTLLKSPNMWAVMCAYFTYVYCLWIFLTWLPTYLVEYRQFTLLRGGLLASLPLWAGVIGDTVGGLATDWLLVRTAPP